VKESLRKYAPINLFPRLVEGEDVLPSGHKVKPGDFILLSSWAMGRNPNIWEDPLRYDPDRFTDAALEANAKRMLQRSLGEDPDPATLELAQERMRRRVAAGRDFAYTPFGAGPRSCIGGVFALLATTTVLATCIQRFRFDKVDGKDPGMELPHSYDTTITFPQGAHLRMIPRKVPLGTESGEAAEAQIGAPAR